MYLPNSSRTKGEKQKMSEMGTAYVLKILRESYSQNPLQLLLSMLKYSVMGESQYHSAYLILIYNRLLHFDSSNCFSGCPSPGWTKFPVQTHLNYYGGSTGYPSVNTPHPSHLCPVCTHKTTKGWKPKLTPEDRNINSLSFHSKGEINILFQ